jgi:hypothetical protein
MKFMFPLNKILVLSYLFLIFIGCEDKDGPPIVDDSESCSLICEQSQIMYCKEEQCLCKEKMFFTPWRHKGEFCVDLTDSFYVRVAHDGNIDYFEAIDILRMPSSKSLKQNSSISISEDYPQQFIVECFSSRSDSINYDKYHHPYFALVFDNSILEDEIYPIKGTSTQQPSGYRPRGNYHDVDSNFYYGYTFVWDIEYHLDSATLGVDVYSAGADGIYLDDEITIYFERYRE